MIGVVSFCPSVSACRHDGAQAPRASSESSGCVATAEVCYMAARTGQARVAVVARVGTGRARGGGAGRVVSRAYARHSVPGTAGPAGVARWVTGAKGGRRKREKTPA
jgi:hypothetical protein